MEGERNKSGMTGMGNMGEAKKRAETKGRGMACP